MPVATRETFENFEQRFGVPLNRFLRRDGPIVMFDPFMFDEWLKPGEDESTVQCAEKRFGPGAGELLQEIVPLHF